MKKLFSVLAIGLLLMAYACGGGDDPKTVMKDMLNLFDDLVGDLEKADDADAVVAALEKSAVAMKELAPRMKAAQEKFPALKDMKPGAKLPEEFKEFEKRFEELGPKMMGIMGKMMKYASDPKVTAAGKKWQEAMSAMK